MASPAFIYAFDNLGPYRFVELCGLLFGSQYKGFLLGGIGPDGGIDAEINLDNVLGELKPENPMVIEGRIIEPGQIAVLQFKHIVTARVGQVESRSQLLNHFRCNHSSKNQKMCELHKPLVVDKNPSTYILVTNIEVNSNFRSKFIEICKNENPSITNFQIIGLDDLETMVTLDRNIRHLYFPTIFGFPQYNLKFDFAWVKFVQTTLGLAKSYQKTSPLPTEYLSISLMNIGMARSYVLKTLNFDFLLDGEPGRITPFPFKDPTIKSKPDPNLGIEPGKRQEFIYEYKKLIENKVVLGKKVIYEVVAEDEIGNVYKSFFPEEIQKFFL